MRSYYYHTRHCIQPEARGQCCAIVFFSSTLCELMWLSQSCTDLHSCGLWVQHHQPARKVVCAPWYNSGKSAMGATNHFLNGLDDRPLGGNPSLVLKTWSKAVTREAPSLNEAVTAVVLLIGHDGPVKLPYWNCVYVHRFALLSTLFREATLVSVRGHCRDSWVVKVTMILSHKWDISIYLVILMSKVP